MSWSLRLACAVGMALRPCRRRLYRTSSALIRPYKSMSRQALKVLVTAPPRRKS